MDKQRRRISRTTDKGVTYSTCFQGETTPETMAALDAVADAAIQLDAEQQARAYALSTTPGEHLRPRDLQSVTKGALGFNAACRILEALEKDGELVRNSSMGEGRGAGILVWERVKHASAPGPGYALPLSQREHGALLRLLDETLGPPCQPGAVSYHKGGDAPTLRAIRSRLKRPS